MQEETMAATGMFGPVSSDCFTSPEGCFDAYLWNAVLTVVRRFCLLISSQHQGVGGQSVSQSGAWRTCYSCGNVSKEDVVLVKLWFVSRLTDWKVTQTFIFDAWSKSYSKIWFILLVERTWINSDVFTLIKVLERVVRAPSSSRWG